MKGINNNNNNNGNTKLILFSHPTGNGAGGGAILSGSNLLWLVLVLSFFTLASLITLFAGANYSQAPTTSSAIFTSPATTNFLNPATPLPADISEALLHYATFSNSTARMSDADIHAISAAIRRRAPCNLLIFGLGHETLLFRALNHNGRTVFLDENEYYIQMFERRHPNSNLEAYDVSYTTKLSELHSLVASTQAQRRTDCRPVQNLLFSDCKLGINDLPNQLYDVSWDVILVDGPRGYHPDSPGRMAAIFTAGVLARSGGGMGKRVDVFVHDYAREVERVCSEHFLCLENMVFSNGQLSHFVIQNRKGAAAAAAGEDEFEFCLNRNATEAAT